MKSHLAFSVALTLLLMVTGIVMIPLTEGMLPDDRNLMYGLARVPVILAGVLGFYGTRTNPRKAIAFAILLSLILMGTGVVSIANAQNYPPIMQNAIFTVGRVPFIYLLAVFVFKGSSSRPCTGDVFWKTK